MSKLEDEIAALRTQLEDLAERVRLDAVAESFLRGKHPIRQGDFFRLWRGDFATRRSFNGSEDGKWLYFDGYHTTEPHRIPEPDDHERLYTIAEVAEIVAKARKL